jgi:nitrile hydratase beta subunit
MNSIHDMGGMHGLGPIPYRSSEPVFHARWEARVAALPSAMGAWGRWTADAFRFRMERMPAAEYLRASYYERWLIALTELSLESGLIGRTELESGRQDPGAAKQTPALTPDQARLNLTRNRDWSRPEPAPARFRPGDTVRARNINPAGHIRLPRYARGKIATIEHCHGAREFPGNGSLGVETTGQHLYLVRFSARELWGDAANPRDSVCLELYDSYLESA